MSTSFRRTVGVAGLALILLTPATVRAEGYAEPGRPIVIDPQPDWSSRWAHRVCAFARILAVHDPSFQGGAEAICAFVLIE